jgi:hypothetical protein
MYRTSQGERTLRGAERGLFVESLGMIVDYLATDDYEAGIALFDDLQRNQKIALLLGVSKALLRDNVSAPPLKAASEAAVAAVYRHAQERVADEIEVPGSCQLEVEEDVWGEEPDDAGPSWRTLVRDACRKTLQVDDLPATDDANAEKWSFLIDCLQDRVLWDSDWEMAEQQDVAPDQRQDIRQELGIEADYYVWIPPDPTDDSAARMLAELQHLTPAGRRLVDSPS